MYGTNKTSTLQKVQEHKVLERSIDDISTTVSVKPVSRSNPISLLSSTVLAVIIDELFSSSTCEGGKSKDWW